MDIIHFFFDQVRIEAKIGYLPEEPKAERPSFVGQLPFLCVSRFNSGRSDIDLGRLVGASLGSISETH